MTEEHKKMRLEQLRRELAAFQAERTRCESGPNKRYASDRCAQLEADILRVESGGRG
jgi:hypothetical protein